MLEDREYIPNRKKDSKIRYIDLIFKTFDSKIIHKSRSIEGPTYKDDPPEVIRQHYIFLFNECSVSVYDVYREENSDMFNPVVSICNEKKSFDKIDETRSLLEQKLDWKLTGIQ